MHRLRIVGPPFERTPAACARCERVLKGFATEVTYLDRRWRTGTSRLVEREEGNVEVLEGGQQAVQSALVNNPPNSDRSDHPNRSAGLTERLDASQWD
jgi:hypothetical protein